MTYFRKTQWLLWLMMWVGIPAAFVFMVITRVWTRQLIGDSLNGTTAQIVWQIAWHIPILLLFVLMPRLKERTRRRRQRAHESIDYSVCFACEHALHRLPIAGACPECGHEYDSQLANHWKVRWEKPLARRHLSGPLKALNIIALSLATLLGIAIVFFAFFLRYFLSERRIPVSRIRKRDGYFLAGR